MLAFNILSFGFLIYKCNPVEGRRGHSSTTNQPMLIGSNNKIKANLSLQEDLEEEEEVTKEETKDLNGICLKLKEAAGKNSRDKDPRQIIHPTSRLSIKSLLALSKKNRRFLSNKLSNTKSTKHFNR